MKNKQRYSQPQWRQIQAGLGIGSSAAHGNFTAYNKQAVNNMFEGIEQFLAVELRP